jgi:hypothetical protein
VDLKKQQKISRSEVDKTLNYCITVLFLYTKIELTDLKVCMKVIINKMFKLKFHRSKFLLNYKTTLDFRVLWLFLVFFFIASSYFFLSYLDPDELLERMSNWLMN